MEIHVTDNYEQMSAVAADVVTEQLAIKENSVLGLATGSTPEGMYRLLVQRHNRGLDFSKAVTFNLDEYIDLAPAHPQSYHYYMYQHLFNHINVAPENIHIPPGQGEDFRAICSKYDQDITVAGDIDLLILGVGRNGHIGFNEPGGFLSVGTHVIELTPNTIEVNGRFFASREEVPRRAITMGMGAIMKARKIVLLANGPKKASAIRDTVSGKVTTQLPVSFLQLHPNLVLILDREAASQL